LLQSQQICCKDLLQNGVQQLLTGMSQKILPDWKTVGHYILKQFKLKPWTIFKLT